MNPDKDAKLVKKYPLLYAQRSMGPRDTCMCWGFECGDGWYKIIDELSAKIEKLNDEIKLNNDRAREGAKAKALLQNGKEDQKDWDELHGKPLIEAVQVKEKFGTLRFYLGPVPMEYDDQVYDWIREAEKASARTCEYCGEPGTTRGGGWIRTLCDRCNMEDKSCGS